MLNVAYQRMFREEFPRFLIMYPRPASDAPNETKII